MATLLQVFDAVAEQVLLRSWDFNAQGLSNTMWGFATAGLVHSEMFDTIAECVVEQAPEFNAQCLANTVWAYATVGHQVTHNDVLICILVYKPITLNPKP